jgi:hypothetical protein
MNKSERLERYSQDTDEEFAAKILTLLNHPNLDKFCMVDAYYYDYSALPEHLKDKFYRDMYLLYGITRDAEIVSKWIERWDLDN